MEGGLGCSVGGDNGCLGTWSGECGDAMEARKDSASEWSKKIGDLGGCGVKNAEPAMADWECGECPCFWVLVSCSSHVKIAVRAALEKGVRVMGRMPGGGSVIREMVAAWNWR